MIDLINISLQFNGNYLFEDVSLKINSGDRISLVGANGTGKSSLLKIISGELQPERGNVARQKNITIGYLPQENITHKGKILLDETKSALVDIAHLQKKEKELTSHLNKNISDDKHSDLINQLGEVHHRLEELDSYSSDAKIKKILTGLGFEEDDFLRLTEEFSGGWQMRIALAKILAAQNDILLMDEPTNHLDLDSLEWLIDFLKNYKGATVIVSHDKHFVNEITNKTFEIFLKNFYKFNGNYNAYLKYKNERDAQTINDFYQQQRKIKETERFIERFRYKASKAKQVQSRIKQLEKIDLIELPEDKSDIKINFPEPPPSGKVIATLTEVSKFYGSKKIFKDLNFQVNRGEKIAFVGPNGMGKTTLSGIIAGITKVTSGELQIGHNVIISHYAQNIADSFAPNLNILETIQEVSENNNPGQLRTLLGSFLFNGDDVFKKIRVLSGGEKSRVALARILLTKANFIILDEPTNHLDITSKEILQKALKEFSGTLILVSHDVDFLKPLVNKVVEIRKGGIKEYPGGIDYYLQKREDLKANTSNNAETAINTSDVSKKDRKRIEAEQRQNKYRASKGIIGKISKLEKQIEILEKDKKHLENTLGDPNFYNDPKGIKNKTEELKIKELQLEKCISEWENLSRELLKIEREYS